MSTYESPADWKSARWWQNREVGERLFHLRVPPRYASALDEDPPTMGARFSFGDSYLFTGAVKSGKTTQAIAYAASLVRQHPLSARFIDADDYVEMIKDSFDNDGLGEMYSSPHLLKYIKGVFDIVVLDALGHERKTDFAVHEMGTLLRHRYDHSLTTIITSNLNLVGLRNAYGDRIGAVIENMQQVNFSARQ